MHERAGRLYARYNDTAGYAARVAALGSRHGVTADAYPAFAEVGPRPLFMPLLDPPDQVVEDGDRIDLGTRELQVVHTPGHEPAHICLLDPMSGAIFSGDHVLPRISPVIMYDDQYDDVLADYLGSLRRVLGLDIGLTYPAHGVPFERGASRVEQLLVHHDRRLADMLERVRLSPTTAWRVMQALFRPNLSPVDQRLALGETVAHLEHLRLGELIELEEREGVAVYRRKEG
jgi:glyoxylase-like metal-dependent hydrolase (beta-lactamase superfamily II)